jgi:hypothetical protein
MASFEWNVEIRPASNGITATFGCRTLVFRDGDADEFMNDLKKYLFGTRENRNNVQKKYFPEMFDHKISQPGEGNDCPEITAPAECANATDRY